MAGETTISSPSPTSSTSTSSSSAAAIVVAIPPYIDSTNPDPDILPDLSRWRQFVLQTQYAQDADDSRQLCGPDASTLRNESLSDLDGGQIGSTYKSQSRPFVERVQRAVLRGAFIPFIFRLVVFSFCLMALGLGGSILRDSRGVNYAGEPNCQHLVVNVSPVMAIVVDSVAIAYIFYIIYDEYRRPPLGLRSGKAKVLILLLDLFFIVFTTVNSTLAFEGIIYYGNSCRELAELQDIKWKQEYLASTLLIALVAWLMTFVVSVLRVVDKMGGLDS